MAGSNITCRLFAAFERFKNPNLIRLAKYLPAYKGKIGLAVCCMLTAGLSSSLIATLLGRLTDAGFYQQQAWVVLAAPIGLILISLLHGGEHVRQRNYLLGQVSQSILLSCDAKYSTACCIGPQKPIRRIQLDFKFVFERELCTQQCSKVCDHSGARQHSGRRAHSCSFRNNWELAMICFDWTFGLAPAIYQRQDEKGDELKSGQHC